MHARSHTLVCIALTLCAGTAAAQPNYQGAYGYQMSLDGGLTWEGPNHNAITFDVPRLTDVRMRLTATLYNQTGLGINGMSGQILFTRNLGHSSDFQVLSPALVPPFNSFSQTLNVSSPDASQAFRIRRSSLTASAIFDARQSPVGSPDFTPRPLRPARGMDAAHVRQAVHDLPRLRGHQRRQHWPRVLHPVRADRVRVPDRERPALDPDCARSRLRLRAPAASRHPAKTSPERVHAVMRSTPYCEDGDRTSSPSELHPKARWIRNERTLGSTPSDRPAPPPPPRRGAASKPLETTSVQSPRPPGGRNRALPRNHKSPTPVRSARTARSGSHRPFPVRRSPP